MRSLSKIIQMGAASLALLAVGGQAMASSHREAPLISQDPLADNTDFYMFVSPDDPTKVTFIANFIPLELPSSGPNFWKFDDFARYEIKIDNNANGTEDITFRFTFKTRTRNANTFLYNTGPVTTIDDPDLNVYQLMTVQMISQGITNTIGSNIPVAPWNVGPNSFPDYDAVADQAIKPLFITGSKVFAGPRDEAFYVDLGSVFDLLQVNALVGKTPVDYTAGLNVHTIALQVPITLVTNDGKVPTSTTAANAVIGGWTTVSRPATRVTSSTGSVVYTGSYVQVSRLGHPLVNEVVIPLGFKNRFNGSQPKDDAQFLKYVQYPEVADLYTLLFGLPVPPEPRDDLVAVFLTGVPGLNQPPNVVACEQLRLNLAIPPTPFGDQDRMGVLAGDLAGFPNGRRLIDDTVDIELQAVAGILIPEFADTASILTDGVDQNDVELLETFPYMPSPWPGNSY